MSELRNLPKITIAAADHARLSNLVAGTRHISPDIAEYLTRELDRADIMESDCEPSRISMGSQVEYRDEDTRQIRSIRLVYPLEADPGNGLISVLTPIGAALIGLSEGQSIVWKNRSGVLRTLTALKVKPGSSSARYRDM
ncbi:MAG: nucleoside diphosphate kinase regulator [Proteobacteria bacterium]|nr:nucleoside diphosphate kinase regulator [Pseudomonadota bacterium]